MVLLIHFKKSPPLTVIFLLVLPLNSGCYEIYSNSALTTLRTPNGKYSMAYNAKCTDIWRPSGFPRLPADYQSLHVAFIEMLSGPWCYDVTWYLNEDSEWKRVFLITNIAVNHKRLIFNICTDIKKDTCLY